MDTSAQSLRADGYVFKGIKVQVGLPVPIVPKSNLWPGESVEKVVGGKDSPMGARRVEAQVGQVNFRFSRTGTF